MQEYSSSSLCYVPENMRYQVFPSPNFPRDLKILKVTYVITPVNVRGLCADVYAQFLISDQKVVICA